MRARYVAVYVCTAVVLSSCAAFSAITETDPSAGLDLRKAVWAPAHGLMSGLNPYDGSREYLSTFGVDVAATIHAPSLLLILSPVAAQDADVAYALMTVLSLVAVWIAALLVVPLDTLRGTLGAVLLGTLLTFTGPAQGALLLGQVTSIAVLGLALVIHRPDSWTAAVGIALLCTSPQFAVPLSLLLLGMGLRRMVVTGWAITAAASLPVLGWAAVNAGGVVPLVDSLVASLRENNTTDITRVDLPGGYLDGDLRATVALLALTVVGAVWCHRRDLDLDPTTALVATSWCLLATYSRPYSIPLALLVAVPAILGGRRGPVEWFATALIVLAAVASVPISALVAAVTGVGTGRVVLVLTVLYSPLLAAIVVSGSVRLGRSRRGQAVRSAGLSSGVIPR